MAPMRGWAPANGWWWRPTKATAPSCACPPPSRWSPTPIPIIWIIYGTFDKMRDAFQRFVENVPFYGFAVLCLDHPEVQAMVGRITDRRIDHLWLSAPGRCPRRQCAASPKAPRISMCVFTDRRKGTETRLDGMQPAHAGRAQCAERLAAIVVARELGVQRRRDPQGAGRVSRASAAASPRSASGTAPPSSTITPTIPSRSPPRCKAARQAYAGPVVAVVQPHRYTRLRDTFEQFATCLNDADVAIIAPVYAAGEQPIEGINRDTYAEALRAHGHRNVHHHRRRGRSRRRCGAATSSRAARSSVLGAGSITALDAQPAEEAGGAGVMMTRPCDALPPVRGTYTPRRAAEGPGLVSRRRPGGNSVPSRRCRRSGDLPGRASPPTCACQRDRRRLQSSGARWRHSRRGGPAAGRVRQDRSRGHARARRRRGAGCARWRAPAADAGIAGLEFLRGVPGTIGGALQDECRLLWPRDQGHLRRSHRPRRQGQQDHAFAPPTWASPIARRRRRDDLIFVEAVFEGTPDDPARHPRPHGRAGRQPRGQPADQVARPAARPSRIRPATRPGS